MASSNLTFRSRQQAEQTDSAVKKRNEVVPLILVVDDNDAGQLLVRTVLELDGFQVDSAGSAKEVMERLRALTPDLILMDVQLPGQDGLALTRQLKADSLTSPIPIVALSAHGMAGHREIALEAGCSGYISKPIDTRTFGTRIRELLRPELRDSGLSDK